MAINWDQLGNEALQRTFEEARQLADGGDTVGAARRCRIIEAVLVGAVEGPRRYRSLATMDIHTSEIPERIRDAAGKLLEQLDKSELSSDRRFTLMALGLAAPEIFRFERAAPGALVHWAKSGPYFQDGHNVTVSPEDAAFMVSYVTQLLEAVQEGGYAEKVRGIEASRVTLR